MLKWLRAAPLLGLASCSGPVLAELPAQVPSYVHPVDHPGNLLERSLALCADKTAAAETRCVRQGLSQAHASIGELASAIPGCRPGRLCALDYTTEDRLGFVQWNSATYRARWNVTVDLRQSGWTPDTVPIVVTQVPSSD